ncbi:hypothetical protein [Pseudomonas sp. PH1b]|uniref:hypothetical protein n=1 Tax=Pseudomonas sp. PH1b TaxID=1397282 RepID=UPI0012FEB2DA|nr:hypothetical protein [Pseudomonas sp. PH1b]
MEPLIGIFTPIAPSFTAALTDLAFLICLALAIVFCFVLGSSPAQNEWRKRCFLLFIGLISGCVVAVLAVPFDPVDGALYSPISNALGLVLTGYIASQLGPLAKDILKPPPANTLDWTKVGYLTFGLIGAALSATVIVVNRTEWIAQAVRCNPDFYARSLPEELRSKMPHDQKTCERLKIGVSESPHPPPLAVYKSLSVSPYSLAYIRALPWQTQELGQCVYKLKPMGAPELLFECRTVGINATSRDDDKTAKPNNSERAR